MLNELKSCKHDFLHQYDYPNISRRTLIHIIFLRLHYTFRFLAAVRFVFSFEIALSAGRRGNIFSAVMDFHIFNTQFDIGYITK